MIHFILTRDHQYTIKAFTRRNSGIKTRVLSYDQLFLRRSLPSGTYIFSDLERLMPWEQHLAAQIADELRACGNKFQILNHPAYVKTRVELLRSLYDAGINRFNVYRADELRMPERFPVFLRWENDHGFPLSDLIETETDLRHQLSQLRKAGHPMRGIIITEYMAQPVREKLYRKLASYRIGDRIMANHHAADDQWNVKYGKKDYATDEDFISEYQFVSENHFESELRKVFEIAGIEYGRADYGLVDNQIQIYEINTNPTIPSGKKEKPAREKTMQLAKEQMFSAIKTLDTGPSSGHKCHLNGPSKLLYKWRRRSPFRTRKRP